MDKRPVYLLIFIFSLFVLNGWATNPTTKDSIFLIKRYTILSDFSIDSTIPVDTSLHFIHYINPLMPDYDSYTSLSRNALPFNHNNLYLRVTQNNIFFPINSLIGIMQNANNSSLYFDSNSPFSSVTYKFFGRLQSKDEFVEASHYRRISRTANIGINYRLFSNKSENDFQHANDHSILIYYKNLKRNVFSYYQFYYNLFEFSENGGIVSDTLINYRNNDFYGTEVNLKNDNSKVVQWGGQCIHQLRFNPFSDSLNVNGGNFTHRILLQADKKVYFTNSYDSLFYKHYFSRSGSLSDSLKLFTVINQFHMSLPNFSRYLPNLRMLFSHAFYHSFHGNNIDTIYFNNIKNSRFQNHQQAWFTAMANYRLRKFVVDISWKSYFLGYGLGDQIFNANTVIGKISDTTTYLKLAATSSLKTPSFFYQSIFLNNYLWNKGDSLHRIKQQEISTQLFVSYLKTYFSVNYLLLKDYIYFDQQGLQQSKKLQHILVYQVKNQFNIGKFFFRNFATYQLFDEKYFHVPSLILFHSSEFWHTFKFSTGGKLLTRIGIDIKYVTSYKPDTYIPPLGIFALTSKSDNSVVNTSDFPFVSFNVSFKVKNVSFYIKYHHASSWLYTRNFTAAHYPMIPAEISYGIRWLFYD